MFENTKYVIFTQFECHFQDNVREMLLYSNNSHFQIHMWSCFAWLQSLVFIKYNALIDLILNNSFVPMFILCVSDVHSFLVFPIIFVASSLLFLFFVDMSGLGL